MKKGKLNKFGLETISDTVSQSADILTARESLSFALGAAVDICGRVKKRVKRDGKCLLVIEPGDGVPSFVVFADCSGDAEIVISRKIRKGSPVRLREKL